MTTMINTLFGANVIIKGDDELQMFKAVQDIQKIVNLLNNQSINFKELITKCLNVYVTDYNILVNNLTLKVVDKK